MGFVPARKHDLLVKIDPSSTEPLYQQVYSEVKAHILGGSLIEGDKLPPIRKLTKSLGVSHATVERAYLQLSVEGYVQNVPRSGYVVNGIDIGFLNQEAADSSAQVRRVLDELEPNPLVEEMLAGQKTRYNFSYCNLQPGSFPRRIWGQLSSEALRSASDEELSRYYCHKGPSCLQVVLGRYLQQARGVVCEPEQIVFRNGTEAVLEAVIGLFDGELECIMHEEPGYEVLTSIANRTRGAKLAPCPVFGGLNAMLCALDQHKPKVIFTTPSHQFPTGLVMPMDCRVELLRWAEENDAYIIEDDSCNEYRYDTQPVPSLQSLDRSGRVIYVCNFSKALSPGLRVAYAVLPPEMLGRWKRRFAADWDPVPYLTMQTLAAFIEQGHWSQHLRRMATDNKRRHDALLECLNSELGERIEISGVASGMHLYVRVHNGMNTDELVASAREKGASVHGTRQYWFSRRPADNAVLIGFSAIAIKDIPEGVRALKSAWFPRG